MKTCSGISITSGNLSVMGEAVCVFGSDGLQVAFRYLRGGRKTRTLENACHCGGNSPQLRQLQSEPGFGPRFRPRQQDPAFGEGHIPSLIPEGELSGVGPGCGQSAWIILHIALADAH